MKKNSSEFRQMQRERILRTKPWLKSKGPVTPEGKAISKMNALKVSPELQTLIKEINGLIKQKKEIFYFIENNTIINF